MWISSTCTSLLAITRFLYEICRDRYRYRYRYTFILCFLFVCLFVSVHSQNKLTLWCRLIAKTSFLVDEHYQPWAYVVKTGQSYLLLAAAVAVIVVVAGGGVAATTAAAATVVVVVVCFCCCCCFCCHCCFFYFLLHSIRSFSFFFLWGVSCLCLPQ